MTRPIRQTARHLLLLVFAAGLAAGCVYYNTFFHAREAFNSAEKARKRSTFGRPMIKTADYKKAIEKSLKVVENHPKSKWYDDAVYVLAISYYYTKQYRNSERRCRELLVNFAESKYAQDARLYLAKAKLAQNEVDAAMEMFTELFDGDADRSFKAEAAMALGTYHFDDRRHAEAQDYFMAIRDSLGNDQEKKVAQTYIADGHFQMFQFKDALGAYLQLLGMDPDRNEKYHSLFRASQCSYMTQQINDGQDYLQTLAQDETYFDSLGVLKLKLAEGYELKDDIDRAEVIYQQVVNEEKNHKVAAQASYTLGLIYQYDYDDLAQAKDYYDKTVELDRNSDNGREALQRSSDIGKRETFGRTLEIDSTTTQDAVDNAGYTQYQLAELYWFKLNKPDTAILEMQYLVDSFPTAYDAPKGMISLSQMIREHEGDTARADSILRSVQQKYPRSDYVVEALELLGLIGTATDTGYAGTYLKKAEQFLIDEDNVDSARTYYSYVVDNFTESEYYLQARFALIWLTETYDSPGDSSLIFAYQDFADSFPGTSWAREALMRTAGSPARKRVIERQADSIQAETGSETEDTTASDTGYVDPQIARYTAPDGSRVINMPDQMRPLEVLEPFEYPTEAYASKFEGILYFQIRLDFTGEVTEYVFNTRSGIVEIDRLVELEVASTIFDVSRLRLEDQGLWFLYKFEVKLPGHLR